MEDQIKRIKSLQEYEIEKLGRSQRMKGILDSVTNVRANDEQKEIKHKDLKRLVSATPDRLFIMDSRDYTLHKPDVVFGTEEQVRTLGELLSEKESILIKHEPKKDEIKVRIQELNTYKNELSVDYNMTLDENIKRITEKILRHQVQQESEP